ncbi:MAG: hypothetical protein WA175_07090, partial [Candidatus Acidiferrales bacterium]
MTRLGRLYDNWMVHVALTNHKLRQRGARILEEAAGASARAAEHALRQAGHDLPTALVILKTGANARDARRWLTEAGGNVREAIEAGKKRRGKMKVRK